jgi:peptide deformylase
MLPVYIYGHPVLRKIAKEIEENYENLGKLIEDMYETMYKTDGVGLAAPQIGKSIKLFVIDASVMGEEFPECDGFKRTFINPYIVETTGNLHAWDEGCLSIPGLNENIKRKDEVVVEYYDENFEYHKETVKGFPAKIIQHEYDHLEGKMFIDHCSPLRKRLLKRKLTSISKGEFPRRYKFVLAK